MTSDKNRKPSELGGGPRRSDVTAEKSISEFAADEDESRLQNVAAAVGAVQYAAIAFNSGGAEVDDKVPAHKPQQSTPTRKTAKIISAAEAYARDRGTVWALAHTQLAAGDRSTVAAWLDKLDECDDHEVRSQYAEFLLRTVVGGNIRVEPFCGRPPPCGPLEQLGLRVADPVLLQQRSSPTTTRLDSKQQRVMPTTRQTFYGRQPIPEDGTICYAAAFSDIF